jgi:hypothetical protein
MKRATFLIVSVALQALTFFTDAQSVDPLTGRLQMPIPIGTLQASDISVPVSVAYQGEALRVDEGESACGLNWSFNFGGSVSRYVRGLPDELNTSTRKGWLHNGNATAVQNFIPAGDDDLSTCNDEEVNWDFLNGRGFVQDTEPDLYVYQAPGLAGQFVLDGAGIPRLLVHDDVNISISPASVIITTNQGIRYTFSTTESVTRKSELKNNHQNLEAAYHYYQTETTFIMRWHLTSIQSLNTGTTAAFAYQNLDEVVSRSYQTQILPTSLTLVDTLYVMKDTYIPRRVVMATLKSLKVELDWENNLVKKVSFQEVGHAEKKEVLFEYESKSNPNIYLYPIHRPFLKSLRMVNDCAPFASFEFSYKDVQWGASNTVSVPWKTKWGQDWFGFFNGQSENRNIPEVRFYSGEINGRRLRVDTLSNATITATLIGQNRSVSIENQGFGALNKVTFPEGGFAEITYEPNVYYDSSANKQLRGGGVRVKKIRTNASEVSLGKSISDFSSYRDITKEYEYKISDAANAISSGSLTAPIQLAYILNTEIIRTQDNQGERPEVLYTRVKEKIAGQGSRVYEYSLPGMFPQTLNGEWKATKSRIARKPPNCPTAGSVKNGFYAFPFPQSSNYTFKRGFLKRVAEFSETGTLVREKLSTPILLTSNSITIKGIRFEKINNVFYYGQYEVLTGRVQTIAQELAREWTDTGQMMQSITTYAYSNHNMLRSITNTLPDLSVSVERFRYAKDFVFTNPPTTDTAAVAIKLMNETFRHGKWIERINTITLPAGTPRVMGAEITLFQHIGQNRIVPHYIKAQIPGMPHTESYVHSSQKLGIDSTYRTKRFFKDYDANGLLLTEYDDKRNKVGYHYATNSGALIATVAHARAHQTVVENFEYTNSFGLTPSTTATYTTGRTGKKAIMLNSIVLSSPLLQKGATKYRISCWAKAASAVQISFRAKNGVTTQQTVVLSNPVNNKWVYLEGIMDMALVSTSFKLEVTANASIELDDIVFAPIAARVSLQTYTPFRGVTSATDDRGNSVVNTFDGAGRPLTAFDRERNLVSRTEYVSQKQIVPFVNANFTSISVQGSSTWYIVGEAVIFTAGDNCGSGYTYQWKVNGVIRGSNSPTLIHTFDTDAKHAVELKVTDALGNFSVFTSNIDVQPGNCVACHPTGGGGPGCYWDGTSWLCP